MVVFLTSVVLLRFSSLRVELFWVSGNGVAQPTPVFRVMFDILSPVGVIFIGYILIFR